MLKTKKRVKSLNKYEKALNKTKKGVISKIQKLAITKENRIVERINTAFNSHNKTLEESVEFLIAIYFDVPELPEFFEIIDNKFCEWV